MDLFNDCSAAFSKDRKYRYALWRTWNKDKPLVLFFGLNPSTAAEQNVDPTIRSVARIANFNGYGGFYMLNCFPYVSTDPDQLRDFGNTKENDEWIGSISKICQDVVFAWGNFPIVPELGRDKELIKKFPKAYCLGKNANGSPKHPLFISAKTKLVPFLEAVPELEKVNSLNPLVHINTISQ
jgi:hypothetical protein